MDSVFMFDKVKLGEQWHLSIWLKFEFKFKVNLQMTLHSTSFKWNCTNIATMNITTTILFLWLGIVPYFDSMIVMLLIEVEPELEAIPFVEDTVTEPRQQGK